MNYREKVETISLGEEAKRRICAALMEQTVRRMPRFSPAGKKLLAVGLTCALVCAVAVPVGVVFGSPKEEINWVETYVNSDILAADEYDPAGGIGAVIGGHKIYYEAGEQFTLRYKLATGQKIVSTEKTENGIEVLSVRNVLSEESKRYKTADNTPWMVYTYEIEMRVADGTKISGGVKFLFENGGKQEMNFYGYCPEGDGRIYTSTRSQDSAFEQYLDHLLKQGKISQDDLGRLRREYLGN